MLTLSFSFLELIIISSLLSGLRITLLLNRVCGHIGVIIIISLFGSTIGPPAEREYAVDPVGVEIITPSAAKFFIDIPFTTISNFIIFPSIDLVIANSFSAS